MAAEFEDACEVLGIPLLVLPPRRPQWNGCVERANRSARIEFWNLYDGPLTVEQVSGPLARYEFFHNYERPHASLAYKTPNEYLVDPGGCLVPSAKGIEPVHVLVSAAILRYDLTRMDSMFMVRVSFQWVCVCWRLPDPTPGTGLSRARRRLAAHGRFRARCV